MEARTSHFAPSSLPLPPSFPPDLVCWERGRPINFKNWVGGKKKKAANTLSWGKRLNQAEFGDAQIGEKKTKNSFPTHTPHETFPKHKLFWNGVLGQVSGAQPRPLAHLTLSYCPPFPCDQKMAPAPNLNQSPAKHKVEP